MHMQTEKLPQVSAEEHRRSSCFLLFPRPDQPTRTRFSQNVLLHPVPVHAEAPCSLLRGLRACCNIYITRAACLGLFSVLPPRLYKGKAKMFNDWPDPPTTAQTAVT
jgi:hypothetical protein